MLNLISLIYYNMSTIQYYSVLNSTIQYLLVIMDEDYSCIGSIQYYSLKSSSVVTDR